MLWTFYRNCLWWSVFCSPFSIWNQRPSKKIDYLAAFTCIISSISDFWHPMIGFHFSPHLTSPSQTIILPHHRLAIRAEGKILKLSARIAGLWWGKIIIVLWSTVTGVMTINGGEGGKNNFANIWIDAWNEKSQSLLPLCEMFAANNHEPWFVLVDTGYPQLSRLDNCTFFLIINEVKIKCAGSRSVKCAEEWKVICPVMPQCHFREERERPSSLFWVQKEEMTEGRKANMACKLNKTRPSP